MEIGIVLGVVVLAGCLYSAWRVSKRRPSHHKPQRDPEMRAFACDICGKNPRDNQIVVAVERRDYELVRVVEYRKEISVCLCGSCLSKIRARLVVFLMMVASFVGALLIPTAIFKIAGTNMEGAHIVAIAVMLVLIVIAIALCIKWHRMTSLRDTWQLKDLRKDGWFVTGYEVVRGDYAIGIKRIFCIGFLIAIFGCFAYFVCKSIIR